MPLRKCDLRDSETSSPRESVVFSVLVGVIFNVHRDSIVVVDTILTVTGSVPPEGVYVSFFFFFPEVYSCPLYLPVFFTPLRQLFPSCFYSGYVYYVDNDYEEPRSQCVEHGKRQME